MKKKFVTFIMSIFLVGAMAVGLSGCEDGKYDIAIRIRFGDEMIVFWPETDEIYREIQYDAQFRSVGMDSYNMPYHPQWSSLWFAPYHAPDVFQISIKMAYFGDRESILREETHIFEGGFYCVTVKGSGSKIWRDREVRLFVNIFY